VRASTAPAPSSGGRLKLTSEGLAWFAAAAVLGLIGWSKSLNLLMMLAYVMIALLVLNGVTARMHANRIRARRILPPPLFAGESAEVAVVVTNAANKSATVRMTDRDRVFALAALAAGKSESFQWMEPFLSRGRIALPPLLAGSSFPFGFLQHDNPQSSEDAVVVLPALGVADADGLRNWLLRMAGSEGRSRKVLRRVTHDHADVRGIRPYRPGDSLRAVHWRSSARRRALMVREYDAAPSPELLLVVEPWLPAEPSAGDRENLESALSLAATIAFTWCRDLSTRVSVVLGSTATTAVDSTLRLALFPLAEAEGSPHPIQPTAAILPRGASRSARLIVSSRPGTPLADSLARELGKPFATLDPSQPLTWYRPPGEPGGDT
jgi:uncharacterized protein (DUF58 family)